MLDSVWVATASAFLAVGFPYEWTNRSRFVVATKLTDYKSGVSQSEPCILVSRFFAIGFSGDVRFVLILGSILRLAAFSKPTCRKLFLQCCGESCGCALPWLRASAPAPFGRRAARWLPSPESFSKGSKISSNEKGSSSASLD